MSTGVSSKHQVGVDVVRVCLVSAWMIDRYQKRVIILLNGHHRIDSVVDREEWIAPIGLEAVEMMDNPLS